MNNKKKKFDDEIVAGEILVVKAKFGFPMYVRIIYILSLVVILVLLIVQIANTAKVKSYQTYTSSYLGYPRYPTYTPTYPGYRNRNTHIFRYLGPLLSNITFLLGYIEIKNRFCIVTQNRVKLRIMGVKYNVALDKIKNIERRGTHILVIHFKQDSREMITTQKKGILQKVRKEKLSLKIDCILNVKEVYQKLWAAIESRAIQLIQHL